MIRLAVAIMVMSMSAMVVVMSTMVMPAMIVIVIVTAVIVPIMAVIMPVALLNLCIGNIIHFAGWAFAGLCAAAAFTIHWTDIGRSIFFAVNVGCFFDFVAATTNHHRTECQHKCESS